MSTSAADVVELLAALELGGVEARVLGGWGVDALAGRQTREHRDLDLAVPASLLETALEVLAGLGFGVTTDWLPVRVEVSDETRHVDVHPLHFQPDGSAWQAGPEGSRYSYPADGWTTGSIGGRQVSCVTAVRQWRAHTGYEPREVDRHDLAVLAALDT